MTFVESLHNVASGLTWSDGRCIPVAPGRWRALFHGGARPLLVCVAAGAFSRAALRYFAGGGVKALYGRILLSLDARIPSAALIPTVCFERPLHSHGTGESPVPDGTVTAIQVGTPGPYQKASALLASERGEALALAKVAMSETADGMVDLEASWLRTIAEMGVLDGQVPRVVAAGKARNGRCCIVTSLAPTTRATRSFTAAHLHFLGALARTRLERVRFGTSPCNERLELSLAELAPHLVNGQARALERALRDCQRSLAGWTGPFVIAQGDFTPWNIRMQGDRVFVFDWEYATPGANPLFDILTYFLMPRAASGAALTPRRLGAALRRAQDVARRLHRAEQWRAKVVSGLALAYLIQVLLFYARSRMRLDPGDPVMREYWALLERRPQWMAAS